MKSHFLKLDIKIWALLWGNSAWGNNTLNNKVHGANMGPIWGRQDPGGPYVGPMNLAIWDNIRGKVNLNHSYNISHKMCVLLCCPFCLFLSSWWIYTIYTSVSLRIASLVLRLFASSSTLNDIGKLACTKPQKSQQNMNYWHNSWGILRVTYHWVSMQIT